MNELNSPTLSTRELIELNLNRRVLFRQRPELIYPWWRHCHLKVLLVTDGFLDFGQGDFGLSTFVHVLQNDAPSRVKFDLTLAHLSPSVSDQGVMAGAPGIMRSIKGFHFDNPDHFMPEMYDQVWLFGASTVYNQDGRGATLTQAELNALSAHMNRGGGVFATGDHGFLGQAMCSQVPRVRNMRRWGDYPAGNDALNHVSMTGPHRNDTTQTGHDPGTQFSDQSDDVPQNLDLLLYTTRIGFLFNATYPHPLLCGRLGRINVFPDHPHEGECHAPEDLTLSYGGHDEYPLDGSGTRVAPEVIAHSRVPAGNTADNIGSKSATVSHTFGAICAYDGHRASVGRVVCDATWHHFVNVNLIGVLEGGGFDQFGTHPGEDASKHNGFLSSAAGLAVLDKIKNYYTNIGVWIASPASQQCFNTLAWWQLIYADRIMEAALADPETPLDRVPASTLLAIGIHARDAFGRRASQCQALKFIIDLIRPLWPEVLPWIDPWGPVERGRAELEVSAPLPTIHPGPLLDVALGAALISLRQAFPLPHGQPTERDDRRAMETVQRGARAGLDLALKDAAQHLRDFGQIIGRGETGA